MGKGQPTKYYKSVLKGWVSGLNIHMQISKYWVVTIEIIDGGKCSTCQGSLTLSRQSCLIRSL
jgi:hypothetical protein